jgi:hypothetical protein
LTKQNKRFIERNWNGIKSMALKEVQQDIESWPFKDRFRFAWSVMFPKRIKE